MNPDLVNYVSDDGRPHFTRADKVGEVYDWLAANGVEELLPLDPVLTICGGKLSFTAFQWKAAPCWNLDQVVVEDGVMLTESRTVDLVAPVTPRLRELAAQLQVELDEALCAAAIAANNVFGLFETPPPAERAP